MTDTFSATAKRLVLSVLTALGCNVAVAQGVENGSFDSSNTAAATRSTNITIEPQLLASALQRFSEQTGLQIGFASELAKGLVSRGTRNAKTPAQALDALLAGTNLTYRFVNDQTVVIRRADEDKEMAQAPDERRDAAGLAQPDAVSESPPSSAQTSSSERQQIEEIVVTGTNIKGVVPVGSPSIVYRREDIQNSGYQTSEQFFRSIPQLFGGGPSSTQGRSPDDDAGNNPAGGASLNLRGLGGGATLVLLNGQRLSPAGSLGGFVDISSIPLSAIERVEILTDGASAIYGADAVAGVVNIITRNDFEGFETELAYGLVTEGRLDQARVAQSAGGAWNTGNIVASYELLSRDPLTAGEKEFARQAPDVLSLQSGRTMHSLNTALRQQLFSAGTFRLQGLYSDSEVDTLFFDGRPTSPQLERDVKTSQFVVSPSFEAKVSKDWTVSLGGSRSGYDATVHQANDRTRVVTRTRMKSSTSSIDALAEGGLFALPGDDIRVAFGAHARTERFEYVTSLGPEEHERDVSAVFGEIYLPFATASNARPGVARPGVEKLAASLSARYDDFSDFGSSFNPKIGLSWMPLPELTLRGSYSTSFNPPNLGDLDGEYSASLLNFADPTSPTGSSLVLFSFSTVPGLQPEESTSRTAGFDYELPLGSGAFAVSATYYDISFTNRVSSVPYPPGATTPNLLLFRDALPSRAIIDDPDPALVASLIDRAIASGGLSDLSGMFYVPGPAYAGPSDVQTILRVGRQNLSSVRTNGVDFEARYRTETDIGSITFGLAGDYILEFDKRAGDNTTVVAAAGTIFNPAKLRLRAHASWRMRGLNLAGFLNYNSGTDDVRSTPSVPVDDFTTMDFTVSYDFGLGGYGTFLSGLNLSASVVNVLDEAPPFVRTDPGGFSIASYDSANADPLGRFITVSLRKRW